MNVFEVATQLLWIVINVFIGFFIGLLLDIILPEKSRIKFQLKKKKFSKWLKNHSYVVGITSRLDFKPKIDKQKIDLDDVSTKLKQIFSAKKPSFKGTELYFKESDIDVIIQLSYGEPADEENEGEEQNLQVESLNITVNSKTKYRYIKNQIDDLRASLDKVEKDLIENLDLFPARRMLYVEMEDLEEFSEILENLKAKQITGVVKDSNVRFAYYKNKLTIEDTINSKTIEWFKNVIAYVG